MTSGNHDFQPGGDSRTTQIQSSGRLPIMNTEESAEAHRAVDVQDLQAGATLTVATRNSTYRLVLRDVDSRAVTVTGGRYRDEPAHGHIEGSSINGIFLTEGRIEVGLSLELEVEGRRLVTSRVQSIVVN